MGNTTFQINTTDPMGYSKSLVEIGNTKHQLWNGIELKFDQHQVKTSSQIFIKNDLHFYRTDYEVGLNILLKVNQEELDEKYIDFRINNLGKVTSIIEEKKLHLNPANKKEKSCHVFIKKELLSTDKETIDAKRKRMSSFSSINKLTSDILSIPATGNNNALLIEGKMLALSHAYLEFLHAPLISTPSFLSCDYKLSCIQNAKNILEENYSNPPTIRVLSKQVGINVNQLKIGFKYLFDTTIRQFVINLRLDEAHHLIMNTRMPLGEICNKVGYVNHGHFSKLYRKKFGVSPLAERGPIA